MTDSRGWKKRDDFRLAATGKRKRKNRKSKKLKLESQTDKLVVARDMEFS